MRSFTLHPFCPTQTTAQVHIFIFVVAAVHVTMGIVMILLASWRLRLWRRMCGDDDEHAQG